MKEYYLDTIKISDHCAQRYAERIMDKDTKMDITVFVASHKQKIKENIFKMIQYGTLLYSGKSVSEFNKQPVDVFLNGTWVVIVDIAKSNVITLYSIDLGLGDEFNNEYIGKLMSKLNKAKEEYEAVKLGIETQAETYSSIIKENEAMINEYRRILNGLEEQNKAYNDVIKSLEVDKTVAEKDIRDIVATFIGKKVF